MTHCYINCKFGFVTDTYPDIHDGEPVLKARFSPDVRHAQPFSDLGEAHKTWQATMYKDWYYCVLWPD